MDRFLNKIEIVNWPKWLRRTMIVLFPLLILYYILFFSFIIVAMPVCLFLLFVEDLLIFIKNEISELWK